MKKILAVSALLVALTAPVMAQDMGSMSGNPNLSDRPSERGLGSDDLARQSVPIIRDDGIDSGTTESILPPGSLDESIAPGDGGNSVQGENINGGANSPD